MNITFKLHECHLGTRTHSDTAREGERAHTGACVWVRCVCGCCYIFILMLQKSGNLHNASSSHVYATLCKNNCTISLKLPVA